MLCKYKWYESMAYNKAKVLKENYRKITIGMTKWKLVEMFGEPDSIKQRENTEIYTWWNSEYRGFLRGGLIERRVIVEMKDDVVTGYDGVNIDVKIL